MLTVTVPAESYNLTSFDRARSLLELPHNVDRHKIIQLIALASAAIAAACNRVFARETVTQTFRPTYQVNELMLARFPVASIASVTENDTTLDPECYELAGSGCLCRLRSDRHMAWPRGKVVVVYDGGYVLPSFATGNLASTLPESIERATLCLVKHYKDSVGRDIFLRSEDVPGLGALTYLDYPGGGDLPAEVEGLISAFRCPAGS